MSRWIAIAGFLSFLFVVLHVVGGGADVHEPILDSGLTDVLSGYVSVIWHLVTASMLVCTALLLAAAWLPSQRVVLTLVVVAQYALYAALFVFYGVVRFDSVLVMPQWIGFGVIALLALVGVVPGRGQAPGEMGRAT